MCCFYFFQSFFKEIYKHKLFEIKTKIWIAAVFKILAISWYASFYTYTANVLTIKIMDFDHVPNPGIMSP